jgi:hypothetical protein
MLHVLSSNLNVAGTILKCPNMALAYALFPCSFSVLFNALQYYKTFKDRLLWIRTSLKHCFRLISASRIFYVQENIVTMASKIATTNMDEPRIMLIQVDHIFSIIRGPLLFAFFDRRINIEWTKLSDYINSFNTFVIFLRLKLPYQ